ncbi:MAG: cupin-like domain-containing protein, partial [bacterium]
MLVTNGKVIIRLFAPKATKYLYSVNDYENFEFRSPINPWNVQPLSASDFDKVKCLEVKLQVGQTIYIPAYWWYSIRFGKNTSVSCFRYRTYMNNVAILPKTIMYLLQ